MTVNLATVTGNIETLTGATPSLARVWFKLNRPAWNLDGDIFAPEYTEAIASGSGAFSVALQSTTDLENGASYSAILRYREPLDGKDREYVLSNFLLPPGGPYQLGDLLTVPFVEPVPADILALATAAAVSAENDRILAQAALDATLAAAAFRRASLAALLATPASEVPVGTRVEVPGLGVYERAPDATPIVSGYPLQGAGVVLWYFVSADGTAPVTAFGAVSDNVSDLTPFLTAVTTAGFAAIVPAIGTGWRLNTPFSQPAGSVVRGGTNKRLTIIRKMFNGDAWTLGEGAVFEGIHLDDRNNTTGTGGTTGNFTGRGMVVLGAASNQRLSDARITGMDGYCLYFDRLAGSNIKVNDCVAVRHNSATGTNRAAVGIENVLAVAAVPRHFVNFSTEGQCSFDLGGSSDSYITNSTLADLNYTTNTVGVKIANSRILNTTAVTIRGNGNGISNCQVLPQITLDAGTDNNAIVGNGYNNAPVIDNSGNGRNLVDFWAVSYTCNLTSGGTPPVLGNGSIQATASRSGSAVTVAINLNIGSTTTLGTGDLRFSLPTFAPYNSAVIQTPGAALLQRAGTSHTGAILLIPGLQYVGIVRDTTGSVTFNSPATWASGDTMRFSFTYQM